MQVQFPAGVAIAFLPTDAMPFDAALAVDKTGHVWAWGFAQPEALCVNGVGKGMNDMIVSPVELGAPLTNVTLVAGASDHTIFDANGILDECGENHDGDLGDGNTKGSLAPVQVVGMQNQDIVSVVASSVDSGALLASGSFYEWGNNAQGQLGNGTIGGTSDVPYLVPLPLSATQATEGGDNLTNGSTLVQLSDGSYWSWGADQVGQLGNGSKVNHPTPTEFYAPAGVTYTTLVCAGEASYGVRPSPVRCMHGVRARTASSAAGRRATPPRPCWSSRPAPRPSRPPRRTLRSPDTPLYPLHPLHLLHSGS